MKRPFGRRLTALDPPGHLLWTEALRYDSEELAQVVIPRQKSADCARTRAGMWGLLAVTRHRKPRPTFPFSNSGASVLRPAGPRRDSRADGRSVEGLVRTVVVIVLSTLSFINALSHRIDLEM